MALSSSISLSLKCTHNTQAGRARVNRDHSLRVRSRRRAQDAVAATLDAKFDNETRSHKLQVLIAGGGLGGLFLSICLAKKGIDVTVLEQTKNYRPLGGPIQLASNGMSVLKATSEQLYRRVQDNSRPFWGTKSGIKDGLTSEWMFEFDAITQIPKKRELPFAVCIDRSDLQRCLLDEIALLSSVTTYGRVNIEMGALVKKFEENKGSGRVNVMLEDGSVLDADLLIGADGIWSSVRAQMFNEPVGVRGSESTASYSGYKLFSGLPIYKSEDYFDIGYCAFIGPDNYFVTCPDRHGRLQWYAFVKSPPNTLSNASPVEFLLNKFSDWSPEVKNLISITSEIDIKQRDLWDRPPCVLQSWSKGRVALLGDSCHATMPNIGQGTGLAFEDAYILSARLEHIKPDSSIDIILKEYYAQRLFRTATIQGLGRMNSEAIKILTPLLPIKPIIDSIVSPFLPIVFTIQFGYCYSFCPMKETEADSLVSAAKMDNRHRLESQRAWMENLE